MCQWNRERICVQRPTAARFAQRAPFGDRALDRAERILEPIDRVGGRRKLLEHRGPLGRGELVEEGRRAPVVGVRLAVRVERGRPPRRHERVAGDDVLRARGLRVVDDVGRVGVSREERGEDLSVEAASGRDRELDRTAFRASSCRKRTKRGSTSSSCRRSGSSALPGQPGRTASSTEVATRFGTTETSSTRRRSSAASRETRARTAFAIDAAARRPCGRRAAR